MSTLALGAQNIARVFQRHGIHIGITAPVAQIHEIAMAINLAGGHDVVVSYERSIAAPGRHALVIGTKAEAADWTDGTGLRDLVYLPDRNADDIERHACIQQLGQVAEALHQLLEEATPCA
ncbi:hypothetical protein CVH10_01710 [Halomonas sp. ND22Bw]|uniref:hypothetical protein n=1 Tax=Halomonas sp. ND22Bw TaxID=2054178 RepID=UPI000D0B563F|nr:hypothetical protein CVH10_01710 [Halomonas sp. ND22Bw]